MRGLLLHFAAALIFAALAAVVGSTAGAGAMGTPTENYTIPDIPTSDPVHDEIKPPVNFILQGPTSQLESRPPNFIADFTGTSTPDKHRVTGNENWYLDIDINTPGWLYIYEYSPSGRDFEGKWIAYKWQLQQSGLWRLGPFIPKENEAEGEHIYRIWFYSEGRWIAEDPGAPQDNLVFWTYVKGHPVEQPQPPPASVPVKEVTFLDHLYRFITNPIVLLTGPSTLAIIILLGIYLSRAYARKRSRPDSVPLLSEPEPRQPSTVPLPAATRASLALPNGMEIQFAGDSRVIGRGDLARALSLDELGLISREHFQVTYAGEQFYIEDTGSANGTRLNGADISGKGSLSLNDGDVIEPAGAIRIKFHFFDHGIASLRSQRHI